jgi:putative DNA methylase
MDYRDRRLIEDYLPIQAISAEASREKSIRKGHISTLHLWWARRPLVACRAAVYGALVSASRFIPENGPDNKKQSLGRANAAKFMKRLCRYPSNSKPEVKADTERAIKEAQRHILEAHAERLTRETGKKVTVGDIEEGRAPRPKVLDMFAGGGAIPLEALRLGCEAYALDLNPVAHIIELCTLVYPQKYGKPDPNVRGMTGSKNDKGETTWGGLAEEVRYWGNWVLKKVKAEIGDLYPLIPDPEAKKGEGYVQSKIGDDDVPPGYLVPVAYLWTRTVRCKNPSCGAIVPLVKQTWLCKKKGGKKSRGRYVALKVIAPKGEKKVRFEVVEAATEKGLEFDPSAGSKGGNATCPFCGTVADIDHVKDEGWAGRMGRQMMSIVCTRPEARGKVYVAADDYTGLLPNDDAIRERIEDLCQRTGLTVPSEPIANLPADCRDNSLGITVRPYGLRTWGDLFTPRQMLCLLTFAAAVREAGGKMMSMGYSIDHAQSLSSYLAFILDKISTRSNTGCPWDSKKLLTVQLFGRQVITMLWDYSESNPLAHASGSATEALDMLCRVLTALSVDHLPGIASRGSASSLPWLGASFDAVITDPRTMTTCPMQTSRTSSMSGSSAR